MKIVILRGGANTRRPRPTGPALRTGRPGTANPGSPHGPSASTRERGVLAIGDGAGHWVLVNMSPAVAHQLDSDQRLDGHPGLLDADVRAVLLTDAQVDHVGGLLGLRDGVPIDLYATPAVFEALTTDLPVLPVLQHYCGVHWHVVPVAGDRSEATFRVDGMPTLEFTAIATQAPAPPHLGRREPGLVGDSIALAVRDLGTGQRVFCAPGLSQFGLPEVEWMRQADCLLLDGPVLENAPGSPASTSAREAVQCAEHPKGPGPASSPFADHRAIDRWLQPFGALPARHKVLVGSPSNAMRATAASRQLADQGFALAYDGMQIEL